jgi:toxin ParE1/3/4
MRLVLHPKVYSDIDEVMGYYERVATRELADEFYAELRHYMRQAAEGPESFPIRERDLRRVNLQRFPYHFLFRIVGESCGFSSCATTEDVPLLASGADNGAQPLTVAGVTDKNFVSTFPEFRKRGSSPNRHARNQHRPCQNSPMSNF